MQTRVLGGYGRGLFLALFLGALTACGGAGGSNGEFEDLDHNAAPPSPGTFLGGDEDVAPEPAVPTCTPVTGPLLDIETFESAIGVIGQDSFTTGIPNNGAGTGFPVPDGLEPWGLGVGTDATGLWVADTISNRVVRIPLPLTSLGPDADLVIGQADLVSNGAGTSIGDLYFPVDVVRAGDRVLVSDFGNNRILIFSPAPTVNGEVSKVVVGQPDFVSSTPRTTQSGLRLPRGIHVVNDMLIVADSGNQRVLIWHKIPEVNNAPADIVIGQIDFNTSDAKLTRSGLGKPMDVWSDGCRLVVSDYDNTRVMIWNSIPKTNGAPANLVLGQPDFTSKYVWPDDYPSADNSRHMTFGPTGVASNGTQLFVADSLLNRVLIWNTFPTANGALPDAVLGQSDWLHNQSNDDNQDYSGGAPSDRTLAGPSGVHIHGKQLFVSDAQNSRVLLFE